MRVVASYTDERGTGESVVSNITDTVARFNHAPVAASPIGDTSARRGALFTFAIPGGAFVDADAGDRLSYSAALANGEALPAWLQFAAETGTFSGTPGTSDIGVVVVQVTATDLAGAHSSQTFTLAVEAGNPDHAPIAEPDAAIVIEDSKRRAQGNVLTNDRDPEGKRLRVADPSNQHGEYGTLTLRANGTYVYVLDDASTKVQGLGAGETATDSFSTWSAMVNSAAVASWWSPLRVRTTPRSGSSPGRRATCQGQGIRPGKCLRAVSRMPMCVTR
ncbi:MAG: putative Ig domain-containing protein [Rhodocyclaceae bacterium]|nr:putative Ig domain-containing protein [Rhodocyclaceae bacterium]